MQQTKFIFFCALLIGASPARAQDQACATPIPVLLSAAAKAEAQLKTVSDLAEKSRAAVVSTYRVVDMAIAKVVKARAENAEVELDRAIGALGTAKKTYDQAVSAERPQLIARIESERALRGARQALTEGANRLREQGQALVNAVERVQRGEVAPSATDMLVCEQGDCVKVSPAEHAALMAVGAMANTVEPSSWPPADRACDFTLFSRTDAQRAMVRSLRAAQQGAQNNLQAAEASLVAARQVLAAGIPGWDGAIAATLNAHGNPVGNSHADELLGMAIEDLKTQDSAFEKLTVPYRNADESAVAARQLADQAKLNMTRHLNYWADLGRAVIDAAARAERGLASRTSSVCPIGPSSQAGPWVFALTPPPNC